MKRPISEQVKNLLFPYVFVLKDGTQNDPQQKLQMIQVGAPEVLYGPERKFYHLYPLLSEKKP